MPTILFLALAVVWTLPTPPPAPPPTPQPAPLSDLDRFPPLAVAVQWQRFNSDLATCWRNQQRLRPHLLWHYGPAIAEADRLSEAWGQLAYAWQSSRDRFSRGTHLTRLRELVGDAAFYTGQIPPCPLAWMQRVE